LTKIVTLPYPLLLQESTRESLGIDLTGHVVIIDEAHNMIDAISALYSTTLSQSQIVRGKQQLEVYLGKFTSRLSGQNKMFIKQILALLRRLERFLSERKGTAGQVTAGELLLDGSTGGLDQINFYKVEKYLRTSGLARKVEGYDTYTKSQDNPTETVRSTTPMLMILQSFLVALNNPRREGRIFYNSTEEGMQFRYLLLDVSNIFSEIVESARAVILAGGTMSPLQSYINALLPDITSDKLRIHSFPHIVPRENLCVATLSRGPTGRELTFDFSSRGDRGIIEELGRSILALAGVVKEGGVVIFVPSYGYLDELFSHWQNTILPKLRAKRKVGPLRLYS
jgi:chromosome transmission fidelity protein 1